MRAVSIFLLFFNAVSAIIGGIGLISDTTGQCLEMSLELLKSTPFHDFLWPGIILFSANGISCLVIGFLAIYKTKGYPWLIMLQGLILTGWLSIQILLIKEFYAPHLRGW